MLTSTAILIGMIPLGILCCIGIGCVVKSLWDDYKRQREYDKTPKPSKPYDSNSEMVKKFQKLAGINPPRRYNDYRDRFRLETMT